MTAKNWLDVPELVGFNITSKCNLKCDYCFEKPGSSHRDPSFREIVAILEQINELSVAELLIEGGEVFILPFINELLGLLKECRSRTHIITNGTMVKREHANILSDSRVSVGVSLDGPTPETNCFRGPKAFHAAVAAVRMLSDYGVETYINCTVTRTNVDRIEDLIKLCESMKAHGLVLQQLHCSGKADYNFYRSNFVTHAQLEYIAASLPKWIEMHPNLFFVESEILEPFNARKRHAKVCSEQYEYYDKKIFRCGAGRRSCVITSDLNIIPCGILEDFPCGNLRDDTFEHLWKNNPRLQYLRRLCEIRNTRIPGCRKCPYRAVCDGGCRGDVFNYSGRWLDTHIFCPHLAENVGWVSTPPFSESKSTTAHP